MDPARPAQARQGHGFLGLSSEVLKAEAPDLLDRLVEAGASVIDMKNHPLPQVKLLAVRRLVYEAVLRQAVAIESRVRMHRGATVDDLIAEPGSSPPRVIGLRTAAGQDCRGDLVIDASGRWTKGAEWLAAVGARPWRDDVRETPFVYVTRHYRLKAGEVFPVPLVASSVDLSYGGATTFKGDDGAFAMAFLTSTFDPYRGVLTKSEGRQRAAQVRSWPHPLGPSQAVHAGPTTLRDARSLSERARCGGPNAWTNGRMMEEVAAGRIPSGTSSGLDDRSSPGGVHRAWIGARPSQVS